MKTCFIILAIFMVFDLVAGLGAALKNGSFKSSIMREGLWHKAGEVGLLVLAVLLDNALPMLGMTFDAHFTALATTALSVMETGSIAENLARLNPDLARILDRFMDIVQPDGKEPPNDD